MANMVRRSSRSRSLATAVSGRYCSASTSESVLTTRMEKSPKAPMARTMTMRQPNPPPILSAIRMFFMSHPISLSFFLSAADNPMQPLTTSSPVYRTIMIKLVLIIHDAFVKRESPIFLFSP